LAPDTRWVAFAKSAITQQALACLQDHKPASGTALLEAVRDKGSALPSFLLLYLLSSFSFAK
jgi:hypothetical protein